MGTDEAGCRQYLSHPDFRALRDQGKHEHVLEASACLPKLRAAVEQDLLRRGLVRDRVLACAVRLLYLGLFRIGSDAYARDNGSYGLTSILRPHVTLGRGEVWFNYPAKSGRQRVAALADPPGVASTAEQPPPRCGRLLIHYQGREWHEVHGSDLNEYLHEVSGTDLTAKDFRTWNATVLAAVGLVVPQLVAGELQTARKRAAARVVREVELYLGNTPACAGPRTSTRGSSSSSTKGPPSPRHLANSRDRGASRNARSDRGCRARAALLIRQLTRLRA
ncbi:hypothetical protein ACFVTF_28635 [Kitasatospora sp. NPDC057940]|uniref:hypothetical protein n=1 Tax=Kitasatospora sp. NPDC057940 TaxID=3346285 RepID=UPI0036DBD1A3